MTDLYPNQSHPVRDEWHVQPDRNGVMFWGGPQGPRVSRKSRRNAAHDADENRAVASVAE